MKKYKLTELRDIYFKMILTLNGIIKLLNDCILCKHKQVCGMDNQDKLGQGQINNS